MIRAPLDHNYANDTAPTCKYSATGQIVCARNENGYTEMFSQYDANTSRTDVNDASREALMLLALGTVPKLGVNSYTGLVDIPAQEKSLANALAIAQAKALAQSLASAQAAARAQTDAQALQLSQAQALATRYGLELAQAQQALSLAQAQNGQRGLIWSRYDQGYFADNPSWFQGQTATATGITNGWTDMSRTPGTPAAGNLPIAKTTFFSLTASGYFVAQTSGSYKFSLSSDDASYMWIGSQAAGTPSTMQVGNARINLSGLHGNVSSSVNVMLVVGQAYPLVLMYGQNGGEYNFRFSFVPPGGVETIDGTGYFYNVLPKGTQIAPDLVTSGLTWYRYDQGYFGDDPTWFQGKTPSSIGSTNGWTDIARTVGATSSTYLPIAQTTRFSFIISGYFVATTTGSYQLNLSSDDASYLWIGPPALGAAASVGIANAVINLAGLHGNNVGSVNVLLVAGQAYPLLILYGQNEGGWNLQFSYVPPGSASTIDGTGIFYTNLPTGTTTATAIGMGGLTWYRYDQGYFQDSPSWFNNISPTATGVTNGWLDISRTTGTPQAGYLPISGVNNFSFLVSGYFIAQQSGSHQFTLSSDDASYMWIGTNALGPAASVAISTANINLGNTHGNNAKTITVTLVAGRAYPMLIMYGQAGGGYNLQLSFTTPGAVSSTNGAGYFFVTAPSLTAQSPG